MTDDGLLLHDPDALKQRRINRGLSQTNLAHRAGIHQAHLSRLESGQSSPTPEVLARIAKVLRCKIADLRPAGKPQARLPRPNRVNGNGAA